jgi:hypothetical protein
VGLLLVVLVASSAALAGCGGGSSEPTEAPESGGADCPEVTGDDELPGALIGCWANPSATGTPALIFTETSMTWMSDGSVCDYAVTGVEPSGLQGVLTYSGPNCDTGAPNEPESQNLDVTGGRLRVQCLDCTPDPSSYLIRAE